MKFYVIVMCAIVICSCRREEYRQLSGTVYGTFYRIVYESVRPMDREIQAEMERVNASLSMFNPSSVISRLNHNEQEKADSLFVRMFRTSQQVHRETNGAFDITVAPLVNAWGFGYKKDIIPLPGYIDSVRQFVGMEKLTLAGNRLQKARKEMEMDASAIAKGLGVDLAAEYLESQGVKNFMVDIGGEIRVRGKSDKKRAWRIGIDRPVDDPVPGERQVQLIIGLTEGALATSGNYRNFYIKEGKKYAHTIDPRSGYPVQSDVVSSTVYAPSCMEADAYATAFMVLGLEESRKVIGASPELEACLIYVDEGQLKVWMTGRFKEFVIEE